MIHKLLTATALSLVLASGTQAAGTNDATKPMAGIYMQAQGEGELASKIIGETVYTSDAQEEAVGDINDLIVGGDGSVKAVVIGVGGFLGVGEKNVAVSFDSLQWVDEEGGGQFAVFKASREDLQNAPEFIPEETAMIPTDEDATQAAEDTEEAAEAPAEPAEDQTAMAPADEVAEEQTAMAPTGRSAEPPLVDIGQLSLSANDLIGAAVYAANDENVGEVGDVRLTSEGEVDSVIVDVGGFLGMGEKPVAITFGSLRFKTDESGSFYVYTDFTRDELDAAPTYDKASYDEQREAMKLTAR